MENNVNGASFQSFPLRYHFPFAWMREVETPQWILIKVLLELAPYWVSSFFKFFIWAAYPETTTFGQKSDVLSTTLRQARSTIKVMENLLFAENANFEMCQSILVILMGGYKHLHISSQSKFQLIFQVMGWRICETVCTNCQFQASNPNVQGVHLEALIQRFLAGFLTNSPA